MSPRRDLDLLARRHQVARASLLHLAAKVRWGLWVRLVVRLMIDPLLGRSAILHRAPTAMLDLGGGAGVAVLLHSFMFPGGSRLTVVDVDRERIREGRALASVAGRKVTFIDAWPGSVELPQHDLVLCVDLLPWLTEAEEQRVLGELRACVRPGGMLVVRHWHGGLLGRLALEISGRPRQAGEPAPTARSRGLDHLQADLVHGGLEVAVLPGRLLGDPRPILVGTRPFQD